MKKILFIFSLFISTISFSQIVVPRTNGTTTPLDMNLFTGRSFRPPAFSDTLTANTSIPQLDSAGKIIYTYDVDGYWMRQNYPRKWVRFFNGSGGSGTDSLSFHSITQSPDSTSAKFNRPNGTGTVLKFIYDTTGGGSGGNGISKVIGINGVSNVNDSTVQSDSVYQKTLFYNKNSVDSALSLVPAQFNPIAGTGMSLSGVYPNITFNSTGTGGITGGSIAWPGTLYSTPTTGTVTSSTITFSPSLASQSAYSIFGRGSGSGTPSFLSSLDSNWIPSLHSQNFYNTKYLINFTAGTGIAISGTYPNVNIARNDTTGSVTWAAIDSVNTPVALPNLNDIYLVGTSPTGAYVGYANNIATYNGTSWTFTAPTTGNLVYIASTAYVDQWTGTNWIRIGRSALIHQYGDSYGTPITIGANDNNGLNLKANGKIIGSFVYTGANGSKITFPGINGSFTTTIDATTGTGPTLNLGGTTISNEAVFSGKVNAPIYIKANPSGGDNIVLSRCSSCGAGLLASFRIDGGSDVMNINSSGVLNLNGQIVVVSTSKASTPIPVMTSTQRDVLTGGVLTGTIVGGSGYTNGTYTSVAYTGGTGTPGNCNIVVSGGAVTSATAFGGYGFHVGDVLTVSNTLIGGTGSGFTYTVTSVTGSAGQQVFNSNGNQKSAFNGNNWTGSTIVSSATTLSITYGTDYIFTGSSATTWTLPAIISTITGRQNGIWIKNRGSASITLNTASGSTLYTTSALSTITIVAGAACQLMPDGTYNLVMFNN